MPPEINFSASGQSCTLTPNPQLNDITARFIQLRSKSTTSDTILNASLPPLWLEASEESRRLIIHLSDLIKKLEIAQHECLLDVFGSNLALGSQIEQITRDIVMTFKRCQQSLKDIYPLFAKPGTPELVFCENARKVYNMWLEKLSAQFKTLQKLYIARRGKDSHPPPVRATCPDSIQSGNSSRTLLFGLNTGSTPLKEGEEGVGYRRHPIQLLELEGNENMSSFPSTQEGGGNLGSHWAGILSSLQEIKDITLQIASIAIVQGTMLDRIDYNIMVSAEQTELAAKALKKRVDDEMFALMVIRNMLILITVLTVLVVFKFTRGDIQRHYRVITNAMQNKLVGLEAGWKAHSGHL